MESLVVTLNISESSEKQFWFSCSIKESRLKSSRYHAHALQSSQQTAGIVGDA